MNNPSFIFNIQTFATTYTTQTYTTSTQTQTTATPISTDTDTETTTTPTVIVLSDKTLVDKEHAERYVRKTIEYLQKHAFDKVKLVTDKEIDDFFEELEKEANQGESEETVPSGEDNP